MRSPVVTLGVTESTCGASRPVLHTEAMTHPLAQYRSKANLTRDALAKLAGTSRQTIHRIEIGAQTPSLDMIRRLVAASKGKLNLDDFLTIEAAE